MAVTYFQATLFSADLQLNELGLKALVEEAGNGGFSTSVLAA